MYTGEGQRFLRDNVCHVHESEVPLHFNPGSVFRIGWNRIKVWARGFEDQRVASGQSNRDGMSRVRAFVGAIHKSPGFRDIDNHVIELVEGRQLLDYRATVANQSQPRGHPRRFEHLLK